VLWSQGDDFNTYSHTELNTYSHVLSRSNSGDGDVDIKVRFLAFKSQWGATIATALSKALKLVVRPKSIPAVRDLVRLSIPGQYNGGKSLVVFGIGKEMGEAPSKPAINKASPPADTWEILLRGVCLGRAEALDGAPKLDSQGLPEDSCRKRCWSKVKSANHHYLNRLRLCRHGAFASGGDRARSYVASYVYIYIYMYISVYI
jgi:hypothetical protein